jgi:hypothetical protein
MLRSIIIFGSSIFFVVLCGCNGSKHSSSKASPPGTWQSTPIVIDGDSKDWPSPYPNYDSKAMIAYASSNDAQNLYITMETGDQTALMKILKQGMTVSVDTGGNKDHQFKINYPLPNDNEPFDYTKAEHAKTKEGGSSLLTRQSEQKISRMVQDANQYSLEGFSGCTGGYLVSQTLPCGIKVKARFDEYKELVWEAVVPFKAIYGRDVTAADAGKQVNVCFLVKGFKAPGPKNADNATNGMNSGMGGAGSNSAMRSGPRSGGGRRTDSQDPMQHLYETTKTWKQFGIAFQH